MDQTDFSMLVGWVIGAPCIMVVLAAVAPLPFWGCMVIAFTLGTLTVGGLVFLSIEWLARDARPPDESPGGDPGK